MEMKTIKDGEYRACKELDELLKKKDWTANDVDAMHKLTGIVKNLGKIEDRESGGYSQMMVYPNNGGMSRNYSQAGSWQAVIDGNYGHSHADGHSYTDGNGHSYARHRDSMGRYSRDGEDYSRTGNSYGNGNSYGGSSMGILEDMLRKADSPREREAIERCMREMRG